ncbi:hypothetical protein GGTG_10758 [Gaeumannomyces tritici R3-111a-1]|uniref:Ribosomal protein S15 n=1 Tax=Gaeumannomyces tritici (strain R3-111a-1) TaxID=644352 RepID=J3PB85_GAET3|nr:hypothetical protein GGTG_10758 [Gaeumannomyces tritici R3-111a-1]EJT71501.1 hypothetical protein GGTG_10758 [Gaeumannomyces tritici R3-111a-1]
MPPRVACPQGFSLITLCLRPAVRPTLAAAAAAAASLQPLVQTASISLKEKKRKAKIDPYWWEQSQQRIAKNKQRQAELRAIRDKEWGSPVHGIPTPFVESLDSAGQEAMSRVVARDKDGNLVDAEPQPLPTSPHLLNYQLTRDELERALADSYRLTRPVPNPNESEAMRLENERLHQERHQKAALALQRITALENASSEDRRHANIRRCIETFGRHATDNFLRPKPVPVGVKPLEPVPRAGPDTGSSEVQIAILTTKIRVLARMYEGKHGNGDKVNKRNLRLLVHRRQKLLKYMERKERGSERWTHMLEKLGLTPATWKDQIAIE